MSAGIGRQEDGGWDVEYAKEEGIRMLTSPVLARYIQDLSAQDTSWFKRKADADRVHMYIDSMLAITPLDFFDIQEDGSMAPRPAHMLDDVQRAALKSVKQKTVRRGDDTYHEIEIELFDKTRLLGLKAKILGMLDGNVPVNPDDAARQIRTALQQIEETDGAGPNG
jgi:hypothetical protein